MNIKMKPTSVIMTRLGIQPNGPLQKYFTKRCADYMDKYVPKDKGNLRDYRIVGNYIIYSQDYARYQYYGERKDHTHKVKNYTTPGTGPFWDKRMWTVHEQEIVKELQDYLGGK